MLERIIDKVKSFQHIYCLPPCPSYDVEGMESWLTDMAKKGYLLEKDGYFAGVASFEKSTPKDLKYRLQAAPKSTSMWADDHGEPDEEIVELSKEFGWEYVTKRGAFYIYRSEEMDNRELHTDPEIQALAMKEVIKRQRSALFDFIFWLFIDLVFIDNNILTKASLFIAMINLRTWFFLFGVCLLLWQLIDKLTHFVHLTKLRKKLEAGEELERRKNWKQNAKFYYGSRFLKTTLIIVWCVMFFQQWGASSLDEDKIPMEEYAKDVPFATMEDYWADSTYELDNFIVPNLVKEWSDWLAPVNYDWQEHATVISKDGRKVSGGLYVDYHETIAPWIAEVIAKEYLRKGTKYYDELELPELDVDYAVGYVNNLHMPSIILREGNKVLHAYCYQVSTDELTFEEWAHIMADSMKNK